MNEKMFAEKLQEWCKKACRYCYDLVQSDKVNLAFYAFQSAPTYNPDILILGLNPGEEHSFDKDNENFSTFEKTLEMFSKGNVFFEKRDTWRIWQGLKRVFSYAGHLEMLEKEDSFMYMNLLYFNTTKFVTFKKKYDLQGDIFKECSNLTAELLSNIVKPKRIICLSINDCYNRLDVKKSTVYIPSYLVRGEWNGIPVYGIRHPSYGNPAESVVGKCLNYLFENEGNNVSQNLINEKFKEELAELKLPKNKLSKNELISIFKEIGKKLNLKPYENRSNGDGFYLNDDLIIGIADYKKGLIGIRHANFIGNKETNYDNKNVEFYPHQGALKELLKERGFKASNVWLGTRKFNTFDGTNESTMDGIQKLIEELTPYNWSKTIIKKFTE